MARRGIDRLETQPPAIAIARIELQFAEAFAIESKGSLGTDEIEADPHLGTSRDPARCDRAAGARLEVDQRVRLIFILDFTHPAIRQLALLIDRAQVAIH